MRLLRPRPSLAPLCLRALVSFRTPCRTCSNLQAWSLTLDMRPWQLLQELPGWQPAAHLLESEISREGGVSEPEAGRLTGAGASLSGEDSEGFGGGRLARELEAESDEEEDMGNGMRPSHARGEGAQTAGERYLAHALC